MTRSYMEICVALRHGVLVQGKATMRFNANITKCAPKQADVEHYYIGLIEAANPDEAARVAASVAAKHFYPVGGDTSFFQRMGDRYLCAAGHYRWDSGYGITKGATLSIRVSPVE